MNKTKTKALQEAIKSGFTYTGDAFFPSVMSAKIAIGGLVKDGYLIPEHNKYGVQYVPTQKALEEHQLKLVVSQLLRK